MSENVADVIPARAAPSANGEPPVTDPRRRAVAPGAASFRKYALLIGFLQKAEIDAILSQLPVHVIGDARVEIEAALRARADLDEYMPGAETALPSALASAEAAIRARDVFQREYAAKGDYEFVSVPIDSLLAPQWQADLQYVDELAQGLAADGRQEDDFDFAFPQGSIAEPMISGNTLLFTSRSNDINISPVPTYRPRDGGYDIVLRAEPRPNYVHVAKLDGRLILINGTHKVLALRKARRTQVYALLRSVARQEELGLDLRASFFAPQSYFRASRPPLVRDFVGGSAVAVPCLWRATQNVFRVVVQVEPVIAPLVV
ncbi:MAG TPA: hypothetical protein VGS06_02240 [Streptosporangiaceae bacterium]|nr:hypothetical protein [Streptosporangiaceae bacterium]